LIFGHKKPRKLEVLRSHEGKIKKKGMVQIVLPAALQFHVANVWQSRSNVKRQTSKRGEEALLVLLDFRG